MRGPEPAPTLVERASVRSTAPGAASDNQGKVRFCLVVLCHMPPQKAPSPLTWGRAAKAARGHRDGGEINPRHPVMVQATSPDGTIASRRQPHIGLSTDAGGQS